MVVYPTDFMESNINMTNTKNPIANITETLVGNKKAKQDTKPSKTVIMLSDTKTLDVISDYAKGVKAGEDSLTLMNEALKVFHDAKVKLCKASEKSSPLFAYSDKVRKMFIDTFIAQGKKKTYVEKMMYPAFLKNVNSGKAITAINSSQEKAKAKGGKGKQVATIDVLIAKLLSHDNFGSLPDNLQYEIRDYLESEGYEITE
jgi:hypothetical protein